MLIVAEALHEQAPSDVRELTATLAAEIGATWPVSPASAILTPAGPRFTSGAQLRSEHPVAGARCQPPGISMPRIASPAAWRRRSSGAGHGGGAGPIGCAPAPVSTFQIWRFMPCRQIQIRTAVWAGCASIWIQSCRSPVTTLMVVSWAR